MGDQEKKGSPPRAREVCTGPGLPWVREPRVITHPRLRAAPLEAFPRGGARCRQTDSSPRWGVGAQSGPPGRGEVRLYTHIAVRREASGFFFSPWADQTQARTLNHRRGAPPRSTAQLTYKSPGSRRGADVVCVARKLASPSEA